MNERYGTELVIEATPERQLRRRVDWTEPPAEGDHQLKLTIAGDDD